MLNGYPLVDVDPFKLQEHSPSVGGEWHPDEFPDLPTLEETKTFVETPGKEEQVLKFAWVNGVESALQLICFNLNIERGLMSTLLNYLHPTICGRLFCPLEKL